MPGRDPLADDLEGGAPELHLGILTGVILEVSRTVGETAPIMFTGAVFFLPFLPQGDLRPDDGDVLHLLRGGDPGTGRSLDLPYRRGALLDRNGLVLNSVSIAFRMYLRRRREVVSTKENVTWRRPPADHLRQPRRFRRRDARRRGERDLRDHRPRQQRQDLVPARAQPHGRVPALGCAFRTDLVQRHRREEDRKQPLRAASPHRRGVPAAGRPADVDLRQRGVPVAPRSAASRTRPTSTSSSSAA